MDGFDKFWSIYPLHRAKKDARKAWDKLAPDIGLLAIIIQALHDQKRERHQRGLRKQWVPEWPLPATWLRGERWEDEPEQRMTIATAEQVKQFREDMQREREAREQMQRKEAQ